MKIVVVAILFHLTYEATGETASKLLSSLAKDFQKWRLSENPETATTRGVYTYNDKLSNYNYTRYDAYKSKVEELQERLKAISEQDLSKGEIISYKVLRAHLTAFLDGYQWRLYKNLTPINFLEGLLRDMQRFPGRVPVETKGDVENYIRRLLAYPQQIDEMEESMRVSITQGTTNHQFTMARLPAMFNVVLNFTDVSESPLHKPFNLTVVHNHLGYSQQDRQATLTRATSAVNSVLERIRSLKRFVENDYVTRTEIGVRSFPRGGEYYESIMKWYLSLDLSPQQVHDMGVKEVNRIATRMREIMKKRNFEGSISEYFAFLMDDPSNFYSTPEELLDGYRQTIADIEPKMSQLFHDLPNLPVVVKAMTSDGPQGTYSRGTLDGEKPGTFWANALRPGDIPKFGMMALTIHETNPGHHHQISLAMTLDVPEFRRSIVYDSHFEAPAGFTTFTSFSEGWALYAEALGEEVDLYTDDLELMGRYSSEIFRAARLVVDTGMHYFNWERDRAVDYVLNYTAFTRATAQTEIDRYITWPGQALTYKIGEMKILELREKAKQKLGSNFDIKDFHRVVLENGRLPLMVLEEHVNDWLDNYTPPTPTPTCTATTPSVPLSLAVFISILSVLVRPS